MGRHANLNEMERSRIICLRDSGSNISEIARELNMTRNTVRKWIRCYGSEVHVNTMPRNVQPRIFTPERLQQLVEVYQQQPFTPIRTFSVQYESTTETVRQALKRAVPRAIPARTHLRDIWRQKRGPTKVVRACIGASKSIYN
ncbi:hypothetical protein PYW07_009628 [Mythimna separata]|uniref:Uncharacterized protein n=1 Tax=Mythimna separata TaxID=271217 RepID=A0AAD7YBV3_MYTSE|nr:hypothetical protein PYW07_009628 [Mythimna separata]